jgi:hypothetical protein
VAHTADASKGWRGCAEVHPPGCPVVASSASGVFVDSRRRSKDRVGIPHPPANCKKRLQAIENKGRESEKESQETLRGCKALKDRGLGAERREVSARFIRDNTRNGTIDLDVCQ